MADVTATMSTIDLRNAQHEPVRGRHVWKLQAMLNVWLRSGDAPAGAEPPPLLVTDGVGGPRTRAVLLDFQAAWGLKADAIAGPLTWRGLLEFDVLTGG
jgi:peptidoglycan hydrolase-like protein with peptidoglycan-binding domain